MRIVIEIQVSNGSAAIVPPAVFENDNVGEQAFYTAVAAAAVSTVPEHTVVLLTPEGETVEKKTYYHPAE